MLYWLLVCFLAFVNLGEGAVHEERLPKAAICHYKQKAREAEFASERLSHALSNQQVELEMLQERLNNQELAFEALRADLEKTLSKQNASLARELMGKIEKVEQNLALAIKDLTRMRSEINDKFSQIDQELKQAEGALAKQVKNTAHLEMATQSVLALLEGDRKKEDGSQEESYVVKSGDTLEKIARRFKTSVEALKAKNQIGASNIIHPGQTLHIP
ncbi:MAG: LysM domain [Chlamydiales bacterium]|jgi:LysM repeat protein|nr:LysM domain [Chlamydiales bacterium]